MKVGLFIIATVFGLINFWNIWRSLSGAPFLIWVVCTAMVHIFTAAANGVK